VIGLALLALAGCGGGSGGPSAPSPEAGAGEEPARTAPGTLPLKKVGAPLD
jgi:hypothetical protein